MFPPQNYEFQLTPDPDFVVQILIGLVCLQRSIMKIQSLGISKSASEIILYDKVMICRIRKYFHIPVLNQLANFIKFR